MGDAKRLMSFCCFFHLLGLDLTTLWWHSLKILCTHPSANEHIKTVLSRWIKNLEKLSRGLILCQTDQSELLTLVSPTQCLGWCNGLHTKRLRLCKPGPVGNKVTAFYSAQKGLSTLKSMLTSLAGAIVCRDTTPLPESWCLYCPGANKTAVRFTDVEPWIFFSNSVALSIAIPQAVIQFGSKCWQGGGWRTTVLTEKGREQTLWPFSCINMQAPTLYICPGCPHPQDGWPPSSDNGLPLPPLRYLWSLSFHYSRTDYFVCVCVYLFQNNTSWRPHTCQECTCYGDVAICRPARCPNPKCDFQKVRLCLFLREGSSIKPPRHVYGSCNTSSASQCNHMGHYFCLRAAVNFSTFWHHSFSEV